jgi:hypothetical protein
MSQLLGRRLRERRKLAHAWGLVVALLGQAGVDLVNRCAKIADCASQAANRAGGMLQNEMVKYQGSRRAGLLLLAGCLIAGAAPALAQAQTSSKTPLEHVTAPGGNVVYYIMSLPGKDSMGNPRRHRLTRGSKFLMAHRVRFRTSVDSRGPAVLQEHGKHAGEGDRLAPDKR